MTFAWAPIITNGAGGGGGTAIDDTNYLIVRVPGLHVWRVAAPARFWRPVEELPIAATPFGLDDFGRFYSDPHPTPEFLVRQPYGWNEELIAIAQGAAPTTTTLSAVATGSLNYQWVAAIEGYQYLLTNRDSTAAVDAWSGSGFTSALAGLFVRCNIDSEIDPWDPFSAKGGRLTLSVAKSTAADTFGVDVAKRRADGSENATALTASVDCDDATIPVTSSALFASSGVAYLGTEAVRYAGKTGTSLTSVQRGVYAPFRAAESGTTGFSHPHEVVPDQGISSLSLQPIVATNPRAWIGKRVGLWQHVYDAETGLINRRGDARCVFAGRIKSIRDNPTTMNTDVEVEHELEYLARAVVGESFWTAKVADGVVVYENQAFTIRTFDGVGWSDATPLVAKAAPSGSYEMLAGRYSLTDLITRINQWLDTAATAGDIDGVYNFTLASGALVGATKTRFRSTLPTALSGTFSAVEIAMPPYVWAMFGGYSNLTTVGSGPGAGFNKRLRVGGPSADTSVRQSDGPAMRFVNQNAGQSVEVTDETGTWFDQHGIPDGVTATLSSAPASEGYGVVIFNGQQVVAGAAKDGTTLTLTPLTAPGQLDIFADGFGIPYDVQGDIDIQQIFVTTDTWANFLLKIMYSTGTAGYNHPDYDVYPASIGIAEPGELLQKLEVTTRAISGSDEHVLIVVSKATKLEDLIGTDLKLRWAFFRWKDGGIQVHAWATPTAESSIAALGESNKASPAGTNDEQRSITELSDDWTRNVITINSERDFTLESSDNYRKQTVIIDRVSIDDAGRQKRPETIEAVNSYATEFAGVPSTIDALIPNFKSIAPYFTRPVTLIRRTISPALFESLAVGDDVTFTDGFARDPDTGARGVTSRPGVIVKHGYDPGGLQPGVDGSSIDPMSGQVTVMLFDRIRVGRMVPAAQVDDRATNGGYNAFTNTLTCYAHRFSSAFSSRDAQNMYAGAFVRIVEVDPADPTAPLSWDREVSSQSGNTVTLTSALSSPSWDSSKKYRIIWDDFADADGDQQPYVFQADNADGLVQDLRDPYEYTSNTGLKDSLDPPGLPNHENNDVELIPTGTYGDGVGFDVGSHSAANRLINNLVDYKTALSTPMVFKAPMTVLGDTTHEWNLVLWVPIFLGSDRLPTTVRRKLSVSLTWLSSTGDEVQARFSLCQYPPSGSSNAPITRSLPYVETSTFTTTSTTYTTPDAVTLNVGGVQDFQGVAYLLLEMKVPTASGSAIATCNAIFANLGPRT